MPHSRILPRFTSLGLLLCLVFFFIVAPFFSKGVYARMVLDLSLISLIVLSIYIFSNNKRYLAVGLIMVALAIIRLIYPTVGVDEVSLLFNAGFFAWVIYVLLKRLFLEQNVTMNTIYAAVVAYMLLGVFWGITYTVLEFFWEDSFSLPQSGGKEGTLYTEFGQDMLYYSFVTMTTIGYGDILPRSQPAKFLSVLEAMMGQVYLTVLVARLVGMYIAQKGLRAKNN